MRVFLAGATGVIGRILVPGLLRDGHDVVALVRSSSKFGVVRAIGARVAVADALDRKALTAAIIQAQPDVIIHQLTSIAPAVNLRKFDEAFALTNRLRTEVTDTMIAAGRSVGARRFIAQSFCGWPFARVGGPIKGEDDPLDPTPPARFAKTLAAIRYLEDAVRAARDLNAVALRYGFLYGPGTAIAADGAVAEMVRKRMLPIVGDGAGIWSFVHIEDAAKATRAALSDGPPGIYNIVDDEPAAVAVWLPVLADSLGAKPPWKVPVWVGRLAIGDGGVSMMTQVRGGSNAKAKRELLWRLSYSSWRRGFIEGLGQGPATSAA
jgi:nucleoside-diphosphate-sugar epimerase